MIAALFVQKNGIYYGLPDVDPWDEERDARLYNGPHPIVAHPPCAKYWFGGPSAKERRKLGDDGGCFEAALSSVRKYGGVLEHPAYSYGWKRFLLPCPTISGQWWLGVCGGWSCHVEQGHYGHRARKATWLYAFGIDPSNLPDLIWGPSEQRVKIDAGFHSAEERAKAKASGWKEIKRQGKIERSATPIEFRDILLGIARSCNRE